MNSCSGGGDEVSNPSYSRLDDDMVYMILSNLPVKSLMRFKCVCKSWLFLIQSDPHFAYLHFTRSRIRPNLLINTDIIDPEHLHDTISFFSADLFGVIDHGAAAVYMGTVSRAHKQMLKPVNGLICFIGQLGNAVRIYNPITREATPWIESAGTVKKQKEDLMSNCYIGPPSSFFGFGFDPATKNHKVVCMLTKFNKNNKRALSCFPDVDFCEVLTVGQNSWRRIDDVPAPYKIYRNAFYANGALYWLCLQGYSNSKFAEFIVEFDVGSEKFNRVIPIPNFNLQTRKIHGPQDLLFVDGRIALLDIVVLDGVIDQYPPYTIKMWIFDDSISSSSSSWIEETISLSSDMKVDFLFSFEAIEGTHLIIKGGDRISIDPVLTLYYYDRKKKTWIPRGGITINKPRGEIRFNPADYVISTFVESLFPVQNPQHPS